MTQSSRSEHYAVPEGLWPLAYDAVVFDFDGTIADTARIWDIVDRSFCAERDLEWNPELANVFASMGFKDSSVWVVERFGLDQTPEQVREIWLEGAREQYRKLVGLRPGALEYITALGKLGIPRTLATTNIREVLSALKSHIEVENIFDHVIYGTDVSRNKNYPDIYLEAARRMGVSPENCLVFEDIPQAIRSAHAAGMTVVGVMSGDPTQDIDAVCAEADFILESWTDIQLGDSTLRLHDAAGARDRS